MYWVSNGKQAHLGPENPDKGPRNRAVSTTKPRGQAGQAGQCRERDGREAFRL